MMKQQLEEREKRAAVEAELHAERLKWKDMEITALKTTVATKIAEGVQAALNDMVTLHEKQLAAKDTEIHEMERVHGEKLAAKDEETARQAREALAAMAQQKANHKENINKMKENQKAELAEQIRDAQAAIETIGTKHKAVIETIGTKHKAAIETIGTKHKTALVAKDAELEAMDTRLKVSAKRINAVNADNINLANTLNSTRTECQRAINISMEYQARGVQLEVIRAREIGLSTGATNLNKREYILNKRILEVTQRELEVMDVGEPKKQNKHFSFVHTGTKFNPVVFNANGTAGINATISAVEGTCVNNVHYVAVTLAEPRMLFHFEQILMEYFTRSDGSNVHGPIFITNRNNPVRDAIAIGIPGRWTWASN